MSHEWPSGAPSTFGDESSLLSGEQIVHIPETNFPIPVTNWLTSNQEIKIFAKK